MSLLKKKEVLSGCSLGSRVRCSSFWTPQTSASLYTALLTMSWPEAPRTSPQAGSTHPASKIRGCCPHDVRPGLAHWRSAAAPAAATSRDWETAWGTGCLSHHVICQIILVLLLLHTACKQIKTIWSTTYSSFPFLPITSPYGDAVSAHSNPLCLRMHTWPKNTWLADTFKHGGNQMPKFPNAFAIWEHT